MSIFSHKNETTTPVAETAPVVAEPVAPVEEPTPVATEPTAPDASVPAACNTTTHLMSYPMVKETVEFVEKIPGVSQLESTTKPVAEFVQKQATFMKPVVDAVDNAGVYTLNLADKVAPCLQTVGFEDVANTVEAPFVAAGDALNKSTQWTQEVVQDKVVAPSRKMVTDFRSYYNTHFIDTKGKPLLRSSLDPVMRPVNTYMESMGQKYLPESEPMQGEFSSEIEKNMYLTYDLTKRSIPVVLQMKKNVMMSPFDYVNHAYTVFTENHPKDHNSFTAPFVSSYKTTIDLTTEAFDVTMKTVGLRSPASPDAAAADVAAESTAAPAQEESAL